MLVPIRCFSCGKPIADKYEEYKEFVDKGMDAKQALDKVDLERYCCRSAILGTVELIDLAGEFRRA